MVVLHTAAISEVNPGLQEQIFTHDEIFDLAQGSVIKKKNNHKSMMSLSASFRARACFYFLPAVITPFLLFLKRINMDQKGWCLFFYVTFSTIAVLCSDAFNSRRFTRVNGWSPDHQRSVWSFEAVFVHPHQFIEEPGWILRLAKNSYFQWAATESVCDQKWFSLRSRGVHGPKTSLGMEWWTFFSLPPLTINYSNPYTTYLKLI